jgi:hypothetical protein
LYRGSKLIVELDGVIDNIDYYICSDICGEISDVVRSSTTFKLRR